MHQLSQDLQHPLGCDEWQANTNSSTNFRIACPPALVPNTTESTPINTPIPLRVEIDEVQPALKASVEGTSVILSWRDPTSRFVLEIAGSLTGAPAWQTAPGAPVAAGDYRDQKLPMPAAAQFYRLRAASGAGEFSTQPR